LIQFSDRLVALGDLAFSVALLNQFLAIGLKLLNSSVVSLPAGNYFESSLGELKLGCDLTQFGLSLGLFVDCGFQRLINCLQTFFASLLF